MLSKNNVRLMDQRTSQQRQRFGLRKLTIGVASVLLGTTFMMGTANADVQNGSPQANSNLTTLVSNEGTQERNTTTQSDAQATDHNTDNQGVTPSTAVAQNNVPTQPQTTSNQPTTGPVTEMVETAATHDSSVVSNLTFTGAISGFNNTTFNNNDTADLTYIIRSYGDDSKRQGSYWPVTSQYLALLPAGFTLEKWSIDQFPKNDCQITALGNIGPNGEYGYLIKLNKTPYYGIPAHLKAQMKVANNSVVAGHHDYNGGSATALLMAINDNGIFGSNHSITLGGHTYHVTTNSTYLSNNQVQYTIVPGTQQLASNNYIVEDITSKTQDVTGAGNIGYEEIDPTIKITGTVNDGDYIDIHLGIPYTNSATGQTDYQLYDTNLAANFTVSQGSTKVGTVYNMGSYYRLVLDSDVNSLSNPEINLQLRWASNDNQSSVKKGNVYVYRQTNDPTQNHVQFTDAPTNDVTINGQSHASGLTVNGQYIYVAQPIATGNHDFGASITRSTMRTWNQQGNVAVNTEWSNTQSAGLTTTGGIDEFDLNAAVVKNPQGLVTYQFTTADAMKQAIENDIATADTQHLSGAVIGTNGEYVNLSTVKGQKPRVTVTVQMTTKTDPQNPNHVTATWHVKLINEDPADNPQIKLTGAVPTVTATANNFTMPTGITSYQQDVDQQVETANYSGAKTGNEALMNVLKDLPVALTWEVPYKNGKEGQPLTSPFGGQWQADISYVGNSNVAGGGSASDLVTDTVTIKNADTHAQLGGQLTYQGATGTSIKFSGLQNAFNGLSGYQIVKVVSVNNGGQEQELATPDPTQLDSFIFGTANKNSASQFIIYVRNTTAKATATVTYWDDTTGQKLTHDEATGQVGEAIQFTTMPDAYTNNGYELVGTNPLQNAKYTSVPNEFTIHLKHVVKEVTKNSTVTRTINYVVTGDQSKNPASKTQTVTFTGTGYQDQVTKDYVELDDNNNIVKNADGTIKPATLTWNVTDGDANFIAVSSPIVNGYHVDSIDPADAADGTSVKPVTVTHDTKDIKVTVTYVQDTQDQTAILHFIDDENHGASIRSTLTTTGPENTSIHFANLGSIMQSLANEGYAYQNMTNGSPVTNVGLALLSEDDVTPDWDNLFGKFTNQGTLNFTLHFMHRHGQLANDHQQTVTETINYVHNDAGHTTAAPSVTHSLTFTGTGYHDAVTGQDIITAWQPNDGTSFAAVPNPAVNGFHVTSAQDNNGNNVLDANHNSVLAQTGINHQSPNIIVTVVYAANSQPTQPTKPSEPTTPTQPAKSSEPTAPQSLMNNDHHPVQFEETKQPMQVVKSTTHPSVSDQGHTSTQTTARLPQTGDAKVSVLTGLGLASLIGILGLGKLRKHN